MSLTVSRSSFIPRAWFVQNTLNYSYLSGAIICISEHHDAFVSARQDVLRTPTTLLTGLMPHLIATRRTPRLNRMNWKAGEEENTFPNKGDVILMCRRGNRPDVLASIWWAVSGNFCSSRGADWHHKLFSETRVVITVLSTILSN